MSARQSVLLLLLILGGPSAFPQAATSPPTSPELGKAIASSRKFNQIAKRAAQEGLLQTEASRLAMQNASNKKLQRFAADLVSEQETANAQLATLCRDRRETVSMSLDANHGLQLEALNRTPADAFDSRFLDLLGNSNNKAIEDFGIAAKSDDPQFAKFATSRLEVLKRRAVLLESLK